MNMNTAESGIAPSERPSQLSAISDETRRNRRMIQMRQRLQLLLQSAEEAAAGGIPLLQGQIAGQRNAVP
jgi:hypothetical protein